MTRTKTHPSRTLLGAALLAPMLLASAAHAQFRLPGGPTEAAAIVSSSGAVELTWLDNADNEDGFRIIRERRVGSNWAEPMGITVAPDTMIHVDYPGPGVWSYRLRAYNKYGNSSYTPRAIVEVEPIDPHAPPAKPDAVRVEKKGNVHTLRWRDNANNEIGFEIERDPPFADGVRQVIANEQLFQDSSGEGPYFYRLTAFNRAGRSNTTWWVGVNGPRPDQGTSGGTGAGGTSGGTSGGTTTGSGPSGSFTSGGGGTGSGFLLGGGTTSGGSSTTSYTGGGTGTGGGGGTVSPDGGQYGITEFPILIPGNGFRGPTPQPGPIGSPLAPGYDAKAIARWDVVPYQTFTGEFHIGVVAFHMNGIERVDFSVNGGPWTPVYEMKLNPRTNVWEYTATLDASLFTTEEVEVRAVVWPNGAGEPRLLAGPDPAVATGEHSMFLNADRDGQILANRQVRWVAPWGDDGNPGTEQLPFATIQRAAQSIQSANPIAACADHGLIYLMPGDHAFAGAAPGSTPPITHRAFLTIEGAPGSSVESVRITTSESGTRLNTKLLALRGLTLHGTGLSNSSNVKSLIWFDSCVLSATSKFERVRFAGSTTWTGGVYATDSAIKNVAYGLSGATFQRNVNLTNVLDAFQNASFLVNCSVDGIDKEDDPIHPDVIQWHLTSNFENVIYYGLIAINTKAQGIFVGRTGDVHASDWAYVNVLIEMDPNTYSSQWHVPVNHLVMRHVTHLNRSLLFREGAVTHNVTLRDNVFNYLGVHDDARSGITGHNNHFITGAAHGEGYSTGDPMWINPGVKNYRPATTSPLRGRVVQVEVPADAVGQPRPNPASLGALQP